MDWLWLLMVLAVKGYQITSWALVLSRAILRPFTYALCWKLEILQSDVPPEIMLLVIPIGWAISLPAVSWPQLKKYCGVKFNDLCPDKRETDKTPLKRGLFHPVKRL